MKGDEVFQLPGFELEGRVKWSLISLPVDLEASLSFWGKQKLSIDRTEVAELDPGYNISLLASYPFAEKWSGWLRITDLTNSKKYKWHLHEMPGIQLSIGIEYKW